MMDAFEIDMELLRRVGALRSAVHAAAGDPGGAPRVAEAALAAADRATEAAPGVESALRLLGRIWNAEGVDGDRRATASAPFVDAIEAAALAESPEQRTQLADAAVKTLEAAVDLASPGVTDTAPVADADACEPPVAEEEPSPQPVDLPCAAEDVHALSAELVYIDEDDREQLTELLDRLADVFGENAPDEIAGIAADLEESLEGARWSVRRRALADGARERLGAYLESLAHEIEANAYVAAPVGVVPEPADAEPVDAEAPAAETASVDLPAAEVPSVDLPAAASADDEAEAFGAVAEGEGASGEPITVPEAADPDLLDDFLAEGGDHLDQAEAALLTLESNPGDKEAVNVVFRAFHTIKGVAGFLELHRVTELAHHAESLLSRVREGSLAFSSPVADLTLRSADLLRDLLNGIRSSIQGEDAFVPALYDEILAILCDEPRVERLAAGEALLLESVSATAVESEETSVGAADPDASVRVKTARLDRLLDLVGELVVSHSMVAEDPALDHRSDLMRKVSRSEKILRELQDLTTSMRMVPMKPAFRKATRVVRDVSRRAGKPIHLSTDGEETELDRSMVDVIADPLVHMVRNAIDHGIESPEERVAAGKPREGRIRISAGQLGGSVVIEISDDGRGLDAEKILAKAKSRRIVDSERGMSDSDIFELIFAPGFSTAEQVTDISGRGVGMDVVRRSVEALRGRIEIQSVPGEGSTFSIHLPLTLAITDGMLLSAGDERYIIPMVKIHSSVRPSAEDIYTVTGKGEMVSLHGELLPVVRLGELYDIPGATRNPSEGLLVIVGEGSRRYGLVVDEVLGQQQFVVKALTGQAAQTPGVAGGAILGDGEVGLILDPDELLTLSRKGRSAVA
jgi:two-component system chemotaxis sensor kinase CheA